MKKALLIIVTIALLLGVGYAGYVVFRSKNIVSVEVEGQIQSLYLVDETETPNFQDAKLKINYKSGDAKFIPLQKANIKINDFSTKEETSKTMKITYKNQMVELDYSVVRSGLYYLSQIQNDILTDGKVETKTSLYPITQTNELFFFGEKGDLKYYSYDKKYSRWVLFDGKYNDLYKYEIINRTLSIYLGGNTPNYQLEATANEDGKISVASTSFTYNGEFQTSKTVYSFTHYEFKTNVKMEKLEVVSDALKIDENNFDYLEFKVGDTFAKLTNKVYFKITYSSPLLVVTNSDGSTLNLLQNVYVLVDDSMVKDHTLDTSVVANKWKICTLAYDSEVCTFRYIVVE